MKIFEFPPARMRVGLRMGLYLSSNGNCLMVRQCTAWYTQRTISIITTLGLRDIMSLGLESCTFWQSTEFHLLEAVTMWKCHVALVLICVWSRIRADFEGATVLRATWSNDRSRKRLKSSLIRQGAADVARLITKFYKKTWVIMVGVGVILSMLITVFFYSSLFLLMYF